MSFAEMKQKAWDEHRLMSVLVELTYRCNLDCFICYNDVGLSGRALRREQYMELLEELAAMQVLYLSLTGGEPLAHPDFLAIGARARELGFVVRVKSNGHAFRGRLAQRVREEVDPFLVEVSLHGATAETHDRQTRIPGSFDRLLSNLEEMKAVGLRIRLNVPLTLWNENEIEPMFALAGRIGLPLFIDPTLTPRDDGDKEPQSVAASPEGLERLYRFQDERSRKAIAAGGGGEPAVSIGHLADEDAPSKPEGAYCGAGTGAVTVDPYGNVYPCVQWRIPVGNLHTAKIGEIWNGSGPLAEVRRLSPEIRMAVESLGEAGKMLGFCPGAAWSQTGSALGVEPTLRKRAEAMAEVSGVGRGIPLPSILGTVRSAGQ